MDKKNRSKKQRSVILQSRKGIILLAIIAMMVLVINLITASYSWFTPQSETDKSVGYSYQGQLRSQNCTMSTVLGTKTNEQGNGLYKDQINYDPNLSTNAIPADNEINVGAGNTQYFKTEIVNHDEVNATDVGLFIKVMPACTIAVTYPSNSVRTVSSSTNDYYLIRNAYIKKYVATDVNGPGLLEVEWFVKNTGSSSVKIDLDNLYITYG